MILILLEPHQKPSTQKIKKDKCINHLGQFFNIYVDGEFKDLKAQSIVLFS